jgi:predicted RNase H-related nuclease YkuK (DUF458 family)
MMLDKKDWKTIDGVRVSSILEDFKTALVGEDREVHIGTDSQQNGKFTQYVTVLVVVMKGKGARAWCTKERVPRIRSLRERLMKEVWTSVMLGMELNAHIPETAGLTIHIDANPDVRFKSSEYVKELAAMVVSQGFEAKVKPEAWAASFTADHVVKGDVGSSRH